MPIIGNVGRRSLKVRLLDGGIHLVLILGAVTMVYPLLLMLSGSLKSNIDSRELDVVPEYFYSDAAFYRKWVESKYNEQISEFNLCYRERIYSFDAVQPPRRVLPQQLADWKEFLREEGPRLTEFHTSYGFVDGIGIRPELARGFVTALKNEPDIDGNIERLNAKYGTTFTEWSAVYVPYMNLIRRTTPGALSPIERRMLEFCRTQPADYLNFYSLDSFFIEQTLKPRYGDRVERLNKAVGASYRSWAEVTLPRTVPAGPMRADWAVFVKERLNLQFIRISPEAAPAYRDFLRKSYPDIARYNKVYGASFATFDQIPLPAVYPREGKAFSDLDYFVTRIAAPEHLTVDSTEFRYRDFLRRKYGSEEKLIASQQLGLASFDDLRLPDRLPDRHLAFRDDWQTFVEKAAAPEWVTPDSAASREFRAFLTAPFRKDGKLDIAAMNAALGVSYRTEDDIYVPLRKPANPKLAERWAAFLRESCPKGLLVLDTARAEAKWQEFIRAKYVAVAALNRAYALVPARFDQAALPLDQADFAAFQATRRHSFREFLTRNYAVVLDMMLYNGRAISNTFIYCALSILVALIVNPLAAYALSRYKPPSQYKMLLFLMLTMAFPPMVLGIPNFLLVRQFGLLNTFWALVLPAAANGYSIFLLKGFFDSLPRELYESAQLDGASEWTMFWRITMATSTPILAVIALNAFQLAYANFMFAFILCQDPKMWTIMVHLYQLRQTSSQAVVFASLVIAAVPTLLVFVFCQNIIMKGIVVPTEK